MHRGLCTRGPIPRQTSTPEAEISSGHNKRYKTELVVLPMHWHVVWCTFNEYVLQQAEEQRKSVEKRASAEARRKQEQQRRQREVCSHSHSPCLSVISFFHHVCAQAEQAAARERAAEERGKSLEEQRSVTRTTVVSGAI